MRILSQIVRLHQHYQACHTECRFSAIPLTAGGYELGFVEDCVFRQGSVTLRGWTLAHRLVIEMNGTRQPVPRRIQRGDVMVALGAQMLSTDNQHGRVGFEIKVPWFGGPASLIAEDMPDLDPWLLPLPTEDMVRAERRRTKTAFLRDLVRATPTGLKYLLSGRKPAYRERLRSLLRIGHEWKTGLLLEKRFMGRSASQEADFSAVTIVLPVYNAFDLLTQALERVDRNTDVPWHLVLIDDASPDPRVRSWLIDWTAERQDRVTLLVNDHNLGFIGSVNRGLSLAAQRGGPVILLNSDALVPEDWASRLLRPVLDDDRVASVTPMSNDATILSVPWIASKVALEPGVADLVDAAARTLSPQARTEIPTGVGFCMAMSRAALDLVPMLDPVFGRGYGEEVDWCRKTANAGMIHLGIGNLFVEHRGGESFGSTDKLRALESSGRIISTRYPEFDEDVRQFITADPLLTARLCLALVRAAATDSDPLHVYLGHSLGGGAEYWLAAQLKERSRQGKPTVVIRVGGLRRFRIDLHVDESTLTGETDEIDLVHSLILYIPRRHIVYSCGVGDDRPWELPELLCNLAVGEGSSLEILFHDYFPVSPSLNLLNADGSYTGVPPIESTDSAHQFSADGVHVPLWSWRARWSKAVQRANALTVFSKSSAEIVETAWSEARDKLAYQSHQPLVEISPLPRSQYNGPGAIGILGAIGAVKGAPIVSKLAYYLEKIPNAPKLVIVGEFDHSFPLPPSVKVTGRYDPATLPNMLSACDVNAWLMPSVWPETFSFTTREMLATGLPVMAFNLGAQAEAVRAAANGHIVSADPAAIYDYYQRLRAQIRK